MFSATFQNDHPFDQYEFCRAYLKTMWFFSGASTLNYLQSSSAIQFVGFSKSEIHPCTDIPWTGGSLWKFPATNIDLTAKRTLE